MGLNQSLIFEKNLVELLNRDKKNESVNFVMHSDLDSNGDSSETPNFVQLPFRTYDKVVEYRFDWSPEKVRIVITYEKDI